MCVGGGGGGGQGTGQPKYTTRDYDLSLALLIFIYLKRNLIDSPRCSCGQIETVKHYLFDCINYTQLRHKALSDFTPSSRKCFNKW